MGVTKNSIEEIIRGLKINFDVLMHFFKGIIQTVWQSIDNYWTSSYDNQNTTKQDHTICQTCMMLSSETLQITHGSLGFQAKSEILAVCPPWIN